MFYLSSNAAHRIVVPIAVPKKKTGHGFLSIVTLVTVLSVGFVPPAFAQRLRDEGNAYPNAQEMALLPEWCLYHPSLVKNQPAHPGLEQIHKSGCDGVQHYCWALVEEQRANRSSDAAYRRLQYEYAISNIDFTIRSSIRLGSSCILLAPMYTKQGELYSLIGDHRKSIEMFRKSIAQNPKYELAYSGLSGTYRRQGKYDEAVQALREGLQANPKSVMLKKRLDHLLARQENEPSAADK